MAEVIHLIVEKGEDQGRKITVPPEGSRLGRSSKNDVVLTDPRLSRHHCRLFFKSHGRLWITDLGSANETLINNEPVQESRIRVGDLVTIGNTVLKVVNDGITGVQPEAKTATGPKTPVIDLGLTADTKARPERKIGIGPIVLIACLIAAFFLVPWVLKLFRHKRAESTTAMAIPRVEQTLEIDYEKVEADSQRIFRYKLLIDKDRSISIEIDDTGKTHVRENGTVKKELIQNLVEFIENSGFFDLKDEYMGIQPDNILQQFDLSITIGKKTHKTAVVNRVEPEIFNTVREKLEKFGQVELGLWAMPYSPEKLVEMSRVAFLMGRKLFDEREIKYGNLAEAIKSFQESEFYLKTVDPKPDFYPEVLVYIADCKQDLHQKYNDQNFVAERAIKLRQWEEAAEALRILCEMIPDSSDERHEEARKKLLEVESRLEMKR